MFYANKRIKTYFTQPGEFITLYVNSICLIAYFVKSKMKKNDFEEK